MFSKRLLKTSHSAKRTAAVDEKELLMFVDDATSNSRKSATRTGIIASLDWDLQMHNVHDQTVVKNASSLNKQSISNTSRLPGSPSDLRQHRIEDSPGASGMGKNKDDTTFSKDNNTPESVTNKGRIIPRNQSLGDRRLIPNTANLARSQSTHTVQMRASHCPPLFDGGTLMDKQTRVPPKLRSSRTINENAVQYSKSTRSLATSTVDCLDKKRGPGLEDSAVTPHQDKKQVLLRPKTSDTKPNRPRFDRSQSVNITPTERRILPQLSKENSMIKHDSHSALLPLPKSLKSVRSQSASNTQEMLAKTKDQGRVSRRPSLSNILGITRQSSKVAVGHASDEVDYGYDQVEANPVSVVSDAEDVRVLRRASIASTSSIDTRTSNQYTTDISKRKDFGRTGRRQSISSALGLTKQSSNFSVSGQIRDEVDYGYDQCHQTPTSGVTKAKQVLTFRRASIASTSSYSTTDSCASQLTTPEVMKTKEAGRVGRRPSLSNALGLTSQKSYSVLGNLDDAEDFEEEVDYEYNFFDTTPMNEVKKGKYVTSSMECHKLNSEDSAVAPHQDKTQVLLRPKTSDTKPTRPKFDRSQSVNITQERRVPQLTKENSMIKHDSHSVLLPLPKTLKSARTQSSSNTQDVTTKIKDQGCISRRPSLSNILGITRQNSKVAVGNASEEVDYGYDEFDTNPVSEVSNAEDVRVLRRASIATTLSYSSKRASPPQLHALEIEKTKGGSTGRRASIGSIASNQKIANNERKNHNTCSSPFDMQTHHLHKDANESKLRSPSSFFETVENDIFDGFPSKKFAENTSGWETFFDNVAPQQAVDVKKTGIMLSTSEMSQVQFDSITAPSSHKQELSEVVSGSKAVAKVAPRLSESLSKISKTSKKNSNKINDSESVASTIISSAQNEEDSQLTTTKSQIPGQLCYHNDTTSPMLRNRNRSIGNVPDKFSMKQTERIISPPFSLQLAETNSSEQPKPENIDNEDTSGTDSSDQLSLEDASDIMSIAKSMPKQYASQIDVREVSENVRCDNNETMLRGARIKSSTQNKLIRGGSTQEPGAASNNALLYHYDHTSSVQRARNRSVDYMEATSDQNDFEKVNLRYDNLNTKELKQSRPKRLLMGDTSESSVEDGSDIVSFGNPIPLYSGSLLDTTNLSEKVHNFIGENFLLESSTSNGFVESSAHNTIVDKRSSMEDIVTNESMQHHCHETSLLNGERKRTVGCIDDASERNASENLCLRNFLQKDRPPSKPERNVMDDMSLDDASDIESCAKVVKTNRLIGFTESIDDRECFENRISQRPHSLLNRTICDAPTKRESFGTDNTTTFDCSDNLSLDDASDIVSFTSNVEQRSEMKLKSGKSATGISSLDSSSSSAAKEPSNHHTQAITFLSRMDQTPTHEASQNFNDDSSSLNRQRNRSIGFPERPSDEKSFIKTMSQHSSFQPRYASPSKPERDDASVISLDDASDIVSCANTILERSSSPLKIEKASPRQANHVLHENISNEMNAPNNLKHATRTAGTAGCKTIHRRIENASMLNRQRLRSIGLRDDSSDEASTENSTSIRSGVLLQNTSSDLLSRSEPVSSGKDLDAIAQSSIPRQLSNDGSKTKDTSIRKQFEYHHDAISKRRQRNRSIDVASNDHNFESKSFLHSSLPRQDTTPLKLPSNIADDTSLSFDDASDIDSFANFQTTDETHPSRSEKTIHDTISLDSTSQFNNHPLPTGERVISKPLQYHDDDTSLSNRHWQHRSTEVVENDSDGVAFENSMSQSSSSTAKAAFMSQSDQSSNDYIDESILDERNIKNANKFEDLTNGQSMAHQTYMGDNISFHDQLNDAPVGQGRNRSIDGLSLDRFALFQANHAVN